MKNNRKICLAIIAVFFLIAPGLAPCQSFAATDTEAVDFLDDSFYDSEIETEDADDPLESFNRVMFNFNDAAYTWVFNPVATGYSKIIPEDIRGSVDNFFYNLREPLRFVNTLLQGRFSDSGTVLARFFINTIGGVGGLGDPAGKGLGYPRIHATLGETFGTWGIGDGCYLVMPFFGPTTVRDFAGELTEIYALSAYYNWIDSREGSLGIYLFAKENKLSLHLGEYEDMKQLSFDPYVALRNGYFQYRKPKKDHGELPAD